MNHYEPRGGLAHGDGLKATHVLPFVTNFGLMLEQLEEFQDVPDPYEDDSPEGMMHNGQRVSCKSCCAARLCM